MTLLITILFLGSLRKRDRSGGLGIPDWCSPGRGDRRTRRHVRPGLCSLVPACTVESAVRDRRLQVALSAAGYGLTQTLAAAPPQLVARWENARAAAPYAWAVLTAALDAGPVPLQNSVQGLGVVSRRAPEARRLISGIQVGRGRSLRISAKPCRLNPLR
jgi:hypothetical protein